MLTSVDFLCRIVPALACRFVCLMLLISRIACSFAVIEGRNVDNDRTMSATSMQQTAESVYIPLKRAINNDHAHVVRSLLSTRLDDPNFDLNRRDFDASNDGVKTGRTLLYFVRSAIVAQILLDAKANPNMRDKYGRTPLHVATEAQRIDIVRYVCCHMRNTAASYGCVTNALCVVLLASLVATYNIRRNYFLSPTQLEILLCSMRSISNL
jgi:ankyrin repeat protein